MAATAYTLQQDDSTPIALLSTSELVIIFRPQLSEPPPLYQGQNWSVRTLPPWHTGSMTTKYLLQARPLHDSLGPKLWPMDWWRGRFPAARTMNVCKYKSMIWTTRSSRVQELCESRGGRPGRPSLINLRFLWT